MPKVTLGKAAFYPLGSRVINPSGTVLDVSVEEEKVLRERGVLREAQSEASAVAEVNPSPVPVVVPDDPVSEVAGDYPPLPKKTAPLAEWKEYARQNDIKLVGLTRRNEIMGFVTKTVNASD